jgi:TRAP-type C4-dicarboxylate transport system permease small subunit
MLQILDNLNARVTRALLAVAAAIIFCLGFLVCADIFGRALFNSPVKGTPEIVSMSIVIICFLLAGYAVQSGSMIYTNVFTGMFGVRGEAFGALLSALLGILFFGLIVWGSYEPTLHAWTSGEYEGEGALRVPVWPARIAVLMGAILVVVSYALQAMQAVRSLVSGKLDGVAPPASTHL